MARIDEREIGIRAGLVALAGLGTVVALYRSTLGDLAPPIPYKWIPDLRPVVLFGLTFLLGAFAAFGPGRRRGFFVAFLLAIHGVFAFELETLHWFATIPGPIAGTRADPVRLAAAVSGLAAALLLQVRVHQANVALDLERRGVPLSDVGAALPLLRKRGERAVLAAAGGAIAGGLLVEAASVGLGDEGGLPPAAAFFLGAALVVLLAVAVRWARRAKA